MFRHETCGKFILKLLNCEQKQRRMDTAQEMLRTFNDDPDLMKKVITGDKSWVYGNDSETKGQSSKYKHPEEQFFRIVKNRRAHQNAINLPAST